MNKIKPKTLEREENLIMHLQNFSSLNKNDQINNLDYFATEIGCYASEYNADHFDKILNLTLNLFKILYNIIQYKLYYITYSIDINWVVYRK